MPKLKTGDGDGTGACEFPHEENGCTVCSDRLATCRYYPLGRGAIKLRDSPDKMDFYFLANESFCQGHDESNHQSVDAFRTEQGVEEYDPLNRGWIDILMKMASWKTLGGGTARQGRIAPDQADVLYGLDRRRCSAVSFSEPGFSTPTTSMRKWSMC